MKIYGDLSMKDSVGPTAVGVGTTMQFTPALIMQGVGILIAIWGMLYTRKRWLESKRANDIAEERLNFDKVRHYAETANAQTEKTSNTEEN